MNLIIASTTDIPWPAIIVIGLGLILNGVMVGIWAGRIGSRLDAQAEKLDIVIAGFDDKIDLKILQCRDSAPKCAAGVTDTSPRGVPVLDGG